jgi:uncharacterized damage-inducible protein DinB
MLDRLNAHRAWANRLYLDWYGALPNEAEGAPSDECLKLLSHVIRTETIWLGRLRGETPAAVIWDTLPITALKELAADNDAGWLQVLASDLTRVVSYHRFNGDASVSTVSDITVHACLHGTYHRAQIASRAVREGLPKGPVTDFIAFASGWNVA